MNILTKRNAKQLVNKEVSQKFGNRIVTSKFIEEVPCYAIFEKEKKNVKFLVFENATGLVNFRKVFNFPCESLEQFEKDFPTDFISDNIEDKMNTYVFDYIFNGTVIPKLAVLSYLNLLKETWKNNLSDYEIADKLIDKAEYNQDEGYWEFLFSFDRQNSPARELEIAKSIAYTSCKPAIEESKEGECSEEKVADYIDEDSLPF